MDTIDSYLLMYYFTIELFEWSVLIPTYLLANSLEYPQRIEWSQSSNRLFFFLCLQIFSFFVL